MKWLTEVVVLAALTAMACRDGGSEALFLRIQRGSGADVVVGSPILEGTMLWPFDWVVHGSTAVAVLDDDHDGRFSYYSDRSSRCAAQGELLRCSEVRDRVLLRVLDGELSEIYSQGAAWLETCVTGTVGCAPVAARFRGNTRLARACDLGGADLSKARLKRRGRIDSRQISDWIEEARRLRPRTTYTRHVFGQDVESAVPGATCDEFTACSEWVHTSTTWSLGTYLGADVELLQETRELVRGGA